MESGRDEKALGLHLQQARQKAGLTQQQLCQKSGLSYSTLAKIERGAIKSPSIFTIQEISKVLGVGIDELLGIQNIKDETASQKKTSKSGISFVYFDVNGVLVRFFHRAFTKLASESGISADVIETNFWHYNDAVCRGDLPMDKYNEMLGDTYNIPNFDWSEYYHSTVDPIPQAIELLNWVSEHYKVGLITNIMPGFLDRMLKSGVIPEINYSAVIDSSKVGAIKPEAEIFEIATKESGVKPENILLIDDSRANLMAAERAGWRVSWFDDYQPKESTERVKQALEF